MSAAVTSCQRGPLRYTSNWSHPPPAPPQAPHDRAHLILRHGLLTLLGALGQVLEHQLAMAERHMLLPDGRQPEGTVLPAYSLPAGAEKPRSIRRIAAARTLSLVSPRLSR